jgi:hypothetical protein
VLQVVVVVVVVKVEVVESVEVVCSNSGSNLQEQPVLLDASAA